MCTLFIVYSIILTNNAVCIRERITYSESISVYLSYVSTLYNQLYFCPFLKTLCQRNEVSFLNDTVNVTEGAVYVMSGAVYVITCAMYVITGAVYVITGKLYVIK